MFKKTLAAVAVAAVSVMSSLNSAAAEEEKILNRSPAFHGVGHVGTECFGQSPRG